MRMRRKPWARPELDASEVYIKNPHDFYENWQAAFDKEQPLCMELGCGKGGFITELAAQNPDKNYAAMEKVTDVIMFAAEKAKAEAEALAQSVEAEATPSAHFLQEKRALSASKLSESRSSNAVTSPTARATPFKRIVSPPFVLSVPNCKKNTNGKVSLLFK